MKGIKQIKDYRLIRELGRGANGVVYEAVDSKSNKYVAIKSIPNDKLSNARIMEQFKKELKALYRLSHNNIIKIEGVEKTVNNVYLVLEYCNGGTLYDYSCFYKKKYNKRLPEIIVQRIIKQIMEGLKFMHKKNIIHRDIKLENILINFDDVPNSYLEFNLTFKDLFEQYDLEKDNFTIKIADLGYARDLEGDGGASTICGTPMTIAPEIINIMNENGRDTKYNSMIDLWSLGAVLYELLMGFTPFTGNNQNEVMRNVYKGTYEIPSNLKVSIESIYLLNGLLQFYPHKRLNWDQIAYHPFVTKDSKKFRYIYLNSVMDDNKEKLQIDSKDCSNFLWILFKASGASLPFELDELDKDFYEEIIKDMIANEMLKEEEQDDDNNNYKEKNIIENQQINQNENLDMNENINQNNQINKINKISINEKKNENVNKDNNLIYHENELNEDKNLQNESNFCILSNNQEKEKQYDNDNENQNTNIIQEEIQKEEKQIYVEAQIEIINYNEELIQNEEKKNEEEINKVIEGNQYKNENQNQNENENESNSKQNPYIEQEEIKENKKEIVIYNEELIQEQIIQSDHRDQSQKEEIMEIKYENKDEENIEKKENINNDIENINNINNDELISQLKNFNEKIHLSESDDVKYKLLLMDKSIKRFYENDNDNSYQYPNNDSNLNSKNLYIKNFDEPEISNDPSINNEEKNSKILFNYIILGLINLKNTHVENISAFVEEKEKENAKENSIENTKDNIKDEENFKKNMEVEKEKDNLRDKLNSEEEAGAEKNERKIKAFLNVDEFDCKIDEDGKLKFLNIYLYLNLSFR